MPPRFLTQASLLLALAPLLRAQVPPRQPQTTICGTVFYDVDGNGTYDPSVQGEVPLPDWRIQIEANGITATVFTDSEGRYAFKTFLDPTRLEVLSLAPQAFPDGPPGFVGVEGGKWLPTTPTQVNVVTTVPKVTVDFGNLRMVSSPELARSVNYWATQGREALFRCEPTWRRALNNVCLRQNFSNPNPSQQASTIFTVSMGTPFSSAFAEYRNYLEQPPNGILAYLLARQFSAAKLNTECGPLEGLTVYIDRLGNEVLVPLPLMIQQTRAILCDPRSANTGPGGNAEWNMVIENCLKEWEGMNTEGTEIYIPSLTAE